jgi:methanogenic corrinoid protein MtbC1
MECKEKDKEVCIWREHVRSSIIRTIVECCYPYILKQKKRENKDLGKKVVVVCPPEEYHDIGARIASDFFTLCGYDSVFVGSNTPKEEFLNAINIVRPKYVVISVTNYYNLVNAKEIVENIRDKSSYDIKILVGGYAFKVNPKAYETIGADMLIDSFEDVEKLTNVKWKVESESDI